jgi:hypothetical protein
MPSQEKPEAAHTASVGAEGKLPARLTSVFLLGALALGRLLLVHWFNLKRL